MPASMKGNGMAVKRAAMGLAAAWLVLGAAAAPTGAHAAAIDGKFNAALERLLMNLKDGPVSQMTNQEKKELVTCVKGIFSKIPEEKKQYIATAANQAELRARFDEVGLENRAALKQQVRDECA
jgi:hypothetical protein